MTLEELVRADARFAQFEIRRRCGRLAGGTVNDYAAFLAHKTRPAEPIVEVANRGVNTEQETL